MVNQLISHGPLVLTPYPEYKLCARVMTPFHLSVAIRGVKILYRRCKYPNPHTDDHEAALWKDNIISLLDYGLILEAEAKTRNLAVRDAEWMRPEWKFITNKLVGLTDLTKRQPWWVGCEEWHLYSWFWMMKSNERFYTEMAKSVGLKLPTINRQFDPMDIFKRDCPVDPRKQLVAWQINVRSIPC